MRGLFFRLGCLSCLVMVVSSCAHSERNMGQMSVYKIPQQEAEWIRDGEPIEFEGERWYPRDRLEVLLDSEVILMGQYREIQFFVETRDVRPYNRLYTKFGRNRFRIFQTNGDD